MGKDLGERHDLAADHPKVVERIRQIMEEAREDSEFTRFWPLPEKRRHDIKTDQWIFDRVEAMKARE